MSLLNKMLVELEARQRAAKEAPEDAALSDMRPVPREAIGWRRPALFLLVVVLLAAAYLLARHPRAPVVRPRPVAALRVAPPSPPPVPVTPAQAAVAAPVPAPVAAAPVPVLAPTPSPALAGHPTPAPPARPRVARPHRVTKPRPAPSVGAASKTPAGGAVSRQAVPLSAAEMSQQDYLKAATALEQGVPARARADLRASLAANPLNLGARELLAGLELQRGRDQEAALLLQQGLKLAPGQAHFALLLANIDARQGRTEQALSVLRAHRSAGARDPRYLEFLAALEEQTHDLTAAAADYRAALALAPDVGASWAGLGMAIAATDPGNAIKAFHRALSDPALAAPLVQYVHAELRHLESR